jgi:5-methyltetrahydrofolate--homocysteine methyltransferase
MHTAVKIAQHYKNGVVHVLDASRSVPVVSQLLGNQRNEFLQHINSEYENLREDFLQKKGQKQLLSLTEARENKFRLDETLSVSTPQQLGTSTLHNIPLEELQSYIDWTPFFIVWELHGKYPAILSDEKIGMEASRLFQDAQDLLQEMIRTKALRAEAVFGIWPVEKIGDDDVCVLAQEKPVLHFLRQQTLKAAGQPNLCLADFIAKGKDQFLGAFAVSIQGIEEPIRRYEATHDDYNKILLQALCDRLAEALAEYLHAKVRTTYWGYAANESWQNEDLIAEKYQGIRPAPGYPACPDHTEKHTLFSLLQVEQEIGIQLTESLAMYPASSVCGWYFAHPQSKYFGLGKIDNSQVVDYASRKNISINEATRWLSPVMQD